MLSDHILYCRYVHTLGEFFHILSVVTLRNSFMPLCKINFLSHSDCLETVKVVCLVKKQCVVKNLNTTTFFKSTSITSKFVVIKPSI